MNVLCIYALLAFSGALTAGQDPNVTLPKANFRLSLPTMAAKNGVVYVAYRSFDWLRSSNQLQVLAYDPNSQKVLRHRTLVLPKVSGARVSDGLAISPDGSILAFVEMSEPVCIVLIRADTLSEIRRTDQLPFGQEDYRRHFAGFDGQNQLSFQSIHNGQPRFLRLSSENYSRVSDIIASHLKQKVFSYAAWNPQAHRFWLPTEDIVGSREYTEDGDPTGEVVRLKGRLLEQGGVSLRKSQVLLFFGQLAKGTIVVHQDNKDRELELPCVPSPMGNGDLDYVTAICVTHKDKLPEKGGDVVSSSELLLIKADGPTVAWHYQLMIPTVASGGQLQWGEPALVRTSGKAWIVVPSKSPVLTVYEVRLTN